jgi:putative oxidoreductase
MAFVGTPDTGGRGREALRLLFAVRPTPLTVDLALVLTRVALAWIFIYYGAQKLFGAFNGKGVHGTALYFSNVAHLHPGGFFAVLGGLIEFGGGIAVAAGFCARLAGLALFGDMVLAMITVTWSTGIASISSPPGYQINLALAVLALIIVLLGAGRISVDALIAHWIDSRTRKPAEVPESGRTVSRVVESAGPSQR